MSPYGITRSQWVNWHWVTVDWTGETAMKKIKNKSQQWLSMKSSVFHWYFIYQCILHMLYIHYTNNQWKSLLFILSKWHTSCKYIQPSLISKDKLVTVWVSDVTRQIMGTFQMPFCTNYHILYEWYVPSNKIWETINWSPYLIHKTWYMQYFRQMIISITILLMRLKSIIKSRIMKLVVMPMRWIQGQTQWLSKSLQLCLDVYLTQRLVLYWSILCNSYGGDYTPLGVSHKSHLILVYSTPATNPLTWILQIPYYVCQMEILSTC